MGKGIPGPVFVEQYRELAAEGLDRYGIGDRLNITREAVDMALRRAQKRGDDLTPQPIGQDDVPGDLRALDGACSDEDPELFFPQRDPGRGSTLLYDLQVDEAKAVCNRCPARDLCLDIALRTRPVGVWGGTTEEEREQMRAEGHVA